MPRLRKYKNYDYESDLQQTDSSEDENETYSTGESWLSNAAVVGAIPDEKLHDTLTRYRELVRLLEREVRLRNLKPEKPQRVAKPATQSQSIYTASVSAKRSKTTLSPEQMLNALQMLIALRKAKENG